MFVRNNAAFQGKTERQIERKEEREEKETKETLQ